MKFITGLLLVLALPLAGHAAPTVDSHGLKWFVHIDIIDAGIGRDLAFYQQLIADTSAEADLLLQGHQGPFDGPCCTELDPVSVATFGTTGDGLDVITSQAELDALDALGGSGSRVFFVDSISWCGGSSPGAIGCGDLPACTGNPNDDPDLISVVTLDALDLFDGLAETLAHERGHNSCLGHVAAAECQLMQASNGGGCLTASECSSYQDARTATGGTCECHLLAGPAKDDGLPCTDPAGGLCSGGVCGASGSDASVRLLASGGEESANAATPDDPLVLSGLSGGWKDLGSFGASAAPLGLAYAADRGTLYGVIATAGDDDLVIIDPDTGAITSTVGTVTGFQDFIALAFDPGPTAATSDDRLLAMDDDPGSNFEDLVAIDPDTAVGTKLGDLSTGSSGGFQGLAYDSANDVLYAMLEFVGLFTIDPSCPGSFCIVNPASVSVARGEPGLAYSEDTGHLYATGWQSGPVSLYDVIDPVAATTQPAIGIDAFTPGGLAALPVPEPGATLQLGAGIVGLLALRARRRR